MTAVRTNRRSFENLKTFRTTPNTKIPFCVDRRALPNGLVQIPLHIGIRQRISGIVAHAVDDFCHLPRLVAHATHCLLPVEGVAFRGAQQNATADLVDGNALADYSDIAEQTGLSTATISRVNRCLKYGSDGYAAVIPRIEKRR